MERVSEEAFGAQFEFLLEQGYLRAEDAGRVACVSKTMHLMVSRNSEYWKRQCERAFPSITISPAKEIVGAHYKEQEAEGSLSFMHLYGWQLVKPTGRLETLPGVAFKTGDFALLIDVRVGDEGVLFEAADYGEVRPDTIIRSSSGSRHFRGDFEGACKVGAEDALCLALQGVVERTEKTTLSCTLRLLHKSTGRILELMEKRAISYASHQLLDPRKKSFLQHNFDIDDDWSRKPSKLPPIKAGQRVIQLTSTTLRVEFFFKKGTNATKKRLTESESRHYSFWLTFISC